VISIFENSRTDGSSWLKTRILAEKSTTVEPGQHDRRTEAEPTADPARGRRRSRRWPTNAGAARRTVVIIPLFAVGYKTIS
jgi:hypothetical protein